MLVEAFLRIQVSDLERREMFWVRIGCFGLRGGFDWFLNRFGFTSRSAKGFMRRGVLFG